jgi:hypothetical protein
VGDETPARPWEERFAAVSPWWVLAVGVLARLATLGGTGWAPNLGGFLLFASDPWGSPPIDPAGGYITGSVLGPVVADALALDGKHTFVALHLAVLALAAAATVGLVERYVGRVAASAAAIVLVASPMSNVLLSWLGQPDPWVVLGGTMAATAGLARRTPAIVALGVAGGLIGGLSSFEQAGIAVVLLAFLTIPDGDGDQRVAIAAAVAGVVLGRAGVFAFHQVSDVPFASRLDAARAIGVGRLVRDAFAEWPALVWSMVGGGWLLVADALRRRPAWRLRAALIGIGAFAACAVASDETRVATLVLWPALLRLAVDHVGPEPPPAVVRVVGWTAVLGLAVPPVVVQSATLFATRF